jgi:hypothetical protein
MMRKEPRTHPVNKGRRVRGATGADDAADPITAGRGADRAGADRPAGHGAAGVTERRGTRTLVLAAAQQLNACAND